MTNNKKYGYLYIRRNYEAIINNACKVGITKNLINRDFEYATAEIKRGKYIKVFKVKKDEMRTIENLLHTTFKHLNIYIDAGREIFNILIIDEIEQFLINNKYYYENIDVAKIEKNIDEKIKKDKIQRDKEKQQLLIVPRKDQQDIINESLKYFQHEDRGILILPCGYGKSLLALWIADMLKCNTILIGVFNFLLIEQWKEVCLKIFKHYKILICDGNIKIEKIKKLILENKKFIIITTYLSSYKICELSFIFDIIINDEVHHLTTTNLTNSQTKNTNIKILDINKKYQLSLTATIKEIEEDNDNIISNTNIKYFGNVIVKKSLYEAIKNNIICNYIIQTIIIDTDTINNLVNNDTNTFDNYNYTKNIKNNNLFLSAYCALKSIFENHTNHILIYANNKKNTYIVKSYIDYFLKYSYFKFDDLFYECYNSDIKNKEQLEILDNFNNSISSIIICVYCLGEGYDNSNIDGVIFSENMESNIRIVQSSARAMRKNILYPKKEAKIIIPILNCNNWLDDNTSEYKKIKNVIYQMGLEDETIIEKIKVSKISMEKCNTINNMGNVKKDLEIYDKDITDLLRLKTIERFLKCYTYEKAKKILSQLKIKNKIEYIKLCDNDYRFAKNPEEYYKTQFINWIDYLNIDKNFYDIETCKIKVNEYITKYQFLENLDISEICIWLCENDEKFPPSEFWINYYKVINICEFFMINKKKNKKIFIDL